MNPNLFGVRGGNIIPESMAPSVEMVLQAQERRAARERAYFEWAERHRVRVWLADRLPRFAWRIRRSLLGEWWRPW